MTNFKRGGGFGDRKSSGGGFGRHDGGRRDSGSRSFGGRGDSGDRPAMHQAVCAECGKSCEVPFKPSGDRPIFCSNCFKGKEAVSSPRSGGRDFSRPSFGDRKLFKATCAECGNSCEVPFQPSSGKPVYCSNCFSAKEESPRGSSNSSHGNSNQSNANFEILSAKLDKILRALELVLPTKSSFKAEAAKEVVKPVVVKEVVRPAAVKEVKVVAVKKPVKKVIKKVAAVKTAASKKAKKK
jgi:CxxC-x17-CxxC domain-containing protein